MGTPGAQQAALNALKHSSGLMRTRLTKVLSIRQAPFLKFHIDEGLKREMAVLDLIRKANEEDRARTGGGVSEGADEAPPTDDPDAVSTGDTGAVSTGDTGAVSAAGIGAVPTNDNEAASSNDPDAGSAADEKPNNEADKPE
jgi:hypothetical protein